MEKNNKKQSNSAVNGLQPAFDTAEMKTILNDLEHAVAAVEIDGKIGLVALAGQAENQKNPALKAWVPALTGESLGDESFKQTYGLRRAVYGGAMANGIASVDMIIALGKDGMMGSFGAAGMIRPNLEAKIREIQTALPNGPYAFNLIHSPNEELLERNAVEAYLDLGVHVIEASAFINLTTSLVYYRAAGLSLNPDGTTHIANHVIAKLSRNEVAQKFMEPAPDSILNALVADGKITAEQARLAKTVPVADDITVEGDSGGHTDNRPLVTLFPAIIALRDEIQKKYGYTQPIRIGAGGGISTPAAALAAFMMGAAYVVTGSINQACVESGACIHTKQLLAQAGMADIIMAPSADMFEMGVKVQVLKHGTFFPMRALKLYEIYSRYNSIEEIPAVEREKLEKQVFQRNLDDIWAETVKFFTARDPSQIERAENNPKRKMALIFRWYLGLSSRWSNIGEKGREMDYQIWCGPSIGSFNDWTHQTYLEAVENRRIVDVTRHIFQGAAYLYRVQSLKMQGVRLPIELEQYYPEKPLAD